MKKVAAMMLALCLLLSCSPALADVVYGRLNQKIATRSGPGTHYFEPGTFLGAGDYVSVYSKVWDAGNEIWWVQVEFYDGGDHYRAYTGAWRMDVDLSRVPLEKSMGTVRLIADADAFAGPGIWYALWNDTVYRGTTATLYAIENGYGLIECWNSIRKQYWRVWVPMSDLNYYGSNNNNYSNNYNNSSSYNYNSGSSYGSSYGSWPTGQVCRITASGGNVRSGAGTQYREVGYVKYGESYLVLDTAMASNRVTWYKINFNGTYGWISSGLTNFGKH